jgi:hypothetical protein
MMQAFAIALLFWACSSTPSQDVMTSYSCQTPPTDLAACATDTDCATVVIGCYCGAQPVNGVAHKYATTAQSCEDSAASTCTLGCATQTGMVAQDGNKVDVATTIAVRCDRSSGPGVCNSYVPATPTGGSGDPPSGW